MNRQKHIEKLEARLRRLERATRQLELHIDEQRQLLEQDKHKMPSIKKLPKSSLKRYKLFNQILRSTHLMVFRDRLPDGRMSVKADGHATPKVRAMLKRLADDHRQYRSGECYYRVSNTPVNKRPMLDRYYFKGIPRREK